MTGDDVFFNGLMDDASGNIVNCQTNVGGLGKFKRNDSRVVERMGVVGVKLKTFLFDAHNVTLA